MNREDAVSLLKEVVSSCKSFYYAKAVSIGKDKEGNGCILSISWVPDRIDMEYMSKIAVKRGFELTTAQEKIVFRTLTKP